MFDAQVFYLQVYRKGGSLTRRSITVQFSLSPHRRICFVYLLLPLRSFFYSKPRYSASRRGLWACFRRQSLYHLRPPPTLHDCPAGNFIDKLGLNGFPVTLQSGDRLLACLDRYIFYACWTTGPHHGFTPHSVVCLSAQCSVPCIQAA